MTKRIKIFFNNIAKFLYNLTIDNTVLIDLARKRGVRIGENCRLFSANFGSEPYLITIGNHVTITEGVRFITHDGGVWIFRENNLPNADIVGTITIRDNCFIGVNSIILPGVEIGENCVVAAGSVVTKSIPHNCLVAGVPAKIIKSSDDYLNSVKIKMIQTKNLGAQEKEIFLKNYFGVER